MSTDESAAESSLPRYRSLDMFRGVAVLLMFETHVVNTTLQTTLQEGLLWRVVDFINGLVAPIFLVTAGLVFALATPAMPPSSRTSVVRTWGRQILLLWGIGYLLRAPGLMPSTWQEMGAETWAQFLYVDVLHCIALSWLVVVGLYLAVPRARTRQRILIGLWVVVVAVTPLLWTSPLHDVLPTGLAHYFTSAEGSLFPFFPWSAYVLIGAVAGRTLRAMDRRGKARPCMQLSLLLGGIGGIGLSVPLFTGQRIWTGVPWNGDPLVVTMYALLSLALMAGFFLLIEPGRDGSDRSDEPRPRFVWLQRVGRASLLLYVAHLLILYRAGWNGYTLASVWGGGLDGWEAAALFLGLAVAMTALAEVWRWAKQQRARRLWAQGIGSALAAACLV